MKKIKLWFFEWRCRDVASYFFCIKHNERRVILIAVKKKVAPKKKIEKKKYVCLSCGGEKTEDNFYVSKSSKFWVHSDNRVLVCTECINNEFNENTAKFSSMKTALVISCHRLDVPFYASLYESVIQNNTNFNVGLYLRLINGKQYSNKTFLNSLVDGELSKSEKEAKIEREAKWSRRDYQNRDRIVNMILKYDPYEDYDDNSRKFMFNLTSDYFIDESITDDPHKLQGVIEIVKTYQQIDVINKQIVIETNSSSIDENRVKTLTEIKKQCLDSINKFAKDNGLSASLSAKNSKSSNSLAYYVKLLDEMDFTESKVNLFDIVTCESFRQFADISNANVLKQINLNADELGDMFETQTKMVQQQKMDIAKLKEENRLLKIKVEKYVTPLEPLEPLEEGSEQ